MELHTLLAAIGEEASLSNLKEGWEESQTTFPGVDMECLNPNTVRASGAFAGFDLASISMLLETSSRIKASPELARLFWHCYRGIYDSIKPPQTSAWPRLFHSLGDRCGMFYLLVGVASVPRVRTWHQFLGVPEEVTRHTCRQVWDFNENHRRANSGRMGICLNQVTWLRHYPREPYFRLGRLEFWLKPFRGGVRVFRNQDNGEVLALAEDNANFDDSGYRTEPADKCNWVARFHEDADWISGVPISPFGMAVPNETRLSRAQWRSILCKGDYVLEMHIPQGGGLTPEACATSHRLALEFFPQYFSLHPFAALICNSWMFNTQLEDILSPTANLVRYMRDAYLFPVPSSGQDGLWFIFQKEPFDLRTVPRETSLQRAVWEFIANGNRWRGGGMFILRDDAMRIGEQWYRSCWPPSILGACRTHAQGVNALRHF